MIDARPFTIYFVVGEDSGDHLGAQLMQALQERHDRAFVFCGVGGEQMAEQGLSSLFPVEDIAVMGLTAVLQRLPTIVRRVYQTVDDVVSVDPDILVIIDSPDFTHNVAKRVRKRAPHIPIVDYVSPSVWAWRPGRAKKMAVYVDHLLAILPFEPAAHKRLGGPPTSYVGHPLIENADRLRPSGTERPDLTSTDAPCLLVLPGSRRSETTRLMADFGGAVERLAQEYPNLDVVLPAVPRLRDQITALAEDWAVKPRIVSGQDEKRAAFRGAHAALAASGTVTLELAISGVPMAVAYKLDWFYRRVKEINRYWKIVAADSMVLPNIILGEKLVPEFLDEEANPEALANVVAPLLRASEERTRQLTAFTRLDDLMRLESGESQAGAAARIVLETAAR